MLIGKTDKITFKLAYFIMFGFELVFISFSFFPLFVSCVQEPGSAVSNSGHGGCSGLFPAFHSAATAV